MTFPSYSPLRHFLIDHCNYQSRYNLLTLIPIAITNFGVISVNLHLFPVTTVARWRTVLSKNHQRFLRSHSSVKHELPWWASSLSHAALAIIVRSLLSPPRCNNKPSPLYGVKGGGNDLSVVYLRDMGGISLGRFYGRLPAIEPYPVTRKRKAVWRANDYLLVDETSTFDVFCDTRTHTFIVLVILFKSYSRLSRTFRKTPSAPSEYLEENRLFAKHRSRI